jgi:hypothetical protein
MHRHWKPAHYLNGKLMGQKLERKPPEEKEIIKVLKEIKALLELKPALPAPPAKKGLMAEFIDFVKNTR